MRPLGLILALIAIVATSRVTFANDNTGTAQAKFLAEQIGRFHSAGVSLVVGDITAMAVTDSWAKLDTAALAGVVEERLRLANRSTAVFLEMTQYRQRPCVAAGPFQGELVIVAVMVGGKAVPDTELLRVVNAHAASKASTILSPFLEGGSGFLSLGANRDPLPPKVFDTVCPFVAGSYGIAMSIPLQTLKSITH